MRTDDLRTMLHDNAAQLEDRGLTRRVAAVHDRVALVRRRRRTGVMGAAAAAVLVAAVAVVPGVLERNEPEPADTGAPATLAGWDIPESQILDGFTYEYVRGVESEGNRLVLDLPRSDMPRALSWASSEDLKGTVSVTVDSELVARDSAGGLAEGYPLHEGGKHTIVIRSSGDADAGDLGLAVYEQSDDLPPGISNGVTTFRESIAENVLLGGAIGEPGQSRLSFDVTAPSTRLRFSDFCYGGSADVVAEVYLNGQLVSSADCADGPYPDPGTTGSSYESDAALATYGIEPGSTVKVEMVLASPDGDGARVEAPDAVLGAAVYELGPAAATAAGWEVPATVEYEGRLWAFSKLYESRRGDKELRVDVPASALPQVVTLATGAMGSSTGSVFVDGVHISGWSSNAGGGGYGHEAVLQPHQAHTVRVRVVKGGSERMQIAVIVHRQVR